jgi:hypothetical protein
MEGILSRALPLKKKSVDFLELVIYRALENPRYGATDISSTFT